VRVPADELRVNRARDAGEVALPLLLQEQREEVDLEEQVAELVEQLGAVAPSAASATS
jgi:ribosomal protein L12E/L44/L45/RPP1/RPP2